MPNPSTLSLHRVAVIIAILIPLLTPALAQHDQELVGRQLQRDLEGREALADGLIGMLSEARMPAIEAVRISQAQPDLLALSLQVTMLDQLDLVAQLLRENGQIETRIDDVMVQPASSGEGAQEVRFELPDRIAEGTEFQTHYVSFQFKKLGQSIPGIEWRYPLLKHWTKTVSPENLVVSVTPSPLGQAAHLPATLSTARPLPKPPQLNIRTELLQPRYQLKRLDNVQLQPQERPSSNPQTVKPVTQIMQPAVVTSASRKLATAAEDKPSSSNQLTINPDTLRQISTPQLAHKIKLSDRQQKILTQTDVVRARLPAAQLKNITGLKQEDRARGAQGPGEQTIDLLSIIHADTDIPLNQILGIHRYLHLDRNPDSGVLYYVPRDFNLRWTPDNGFDLNMLYAAVEEGAPGQVLMALRLESGVRAHDNPLIRQLAQAYRKLRQRGLKVEVVRPLPVTSKHPVVNLADSLGAHFDIPSDDLVATVFSDVLAEIEVSWVTDEITKENIELVLGRGNGLGGDVTFTLDGVPKTQVSIPARVRLADHATFGRIPWERNRQWRNRTPYPLRLKRLHALVFDDDTPMVYSWQLGDAEVPPQARVDWQAEAIPVWIDTKASRMWIEYAVVDDCSNCTEAVMRDITYGANRAASRESVRIVTLTPLADLGAAEISVRLRSRYFDSEGSELQTRTPIVVDADRSEFDAGQVYLVERQAGEERPDDPLFEYQIEVVMPDGTIHQPDSDHWVPGHRSRLLIGTVQVEQSLGHLPGQSDDPS